MSVLKTETKCAVCKEVKSIFSYGITYAPRTTHEKGWINKQCKDCYKIGGIDMEKRHIQTELDQREELLKVLKEEVKDLKTLLRHIERKTIMRDDGSVIANED